MDPASEPDNPHGRRVFAHYMVGLTCGQRREEWAEDIQAAKQCGIDGFALNVGPSDFWTNLQLHHAYRVAEDIGGFSLFLSFDMAAGDWPVSAVVDLINEYRESAAQMVVDGEPLVSTFEGPSWASKWARVRDETGGIFLMPDWSSLGPHGVGQKLDLIDGAFSWDAWPKPGQSKMTTVEDLLYREQLRGKKFMMGVSPWFFTNLPQWGKNWYCSSESVWYDRWKQVLEVLPDFVQIITWNDFGESSYISDIRPSTVVQGAEKYVHGHCHAAFRAVLPYLIAAYKAGRAEVDWPGEDTAIAWYRTVPARELEQEGTVWGQGGHIHATHCAKDVVSVMAITRGSALITLTIGDFCRMTLETRSRSPLSYFEVPFDSHAAGPVVLALNRNTTIGPAIRRGGGEHIDDSRPSLNAVSIQVQGGVQ